MIDTRPIKIAEIKHRTCVSISFLFAFLRLNHIVLVWAWFNELLLVY